MLKNKSLHITFIGRLEKEKGIEIIINCIRRARREDRHIIWHICWEGSYREGLYVGFGKRKMKNSEWKIWTSEEQIEHGDIQIHGHLSRSELDIVLKQTDLVIMPSLFLETFGLVALECLSRGVPVCGISKGGLQDFIHPDLAIDPDHPVDSFFSIIDRWYFPISDISNFSYSSWISHLERLVQGHQKILIVSDYTSPVGWAEQYITELTIALNSLGKSVESYGYNGSPSRFTRLWLMFTTLFSYWRSKELHKKIQTYQPDLIWMHQISRYIWPYGVGVVMSTGLPIYLTHHDLGLITPRPSQIYRYSDIPDNTLGSWIIGVTGIISIMTRTYKWLYIKWIWAKLDKKDLKWKIIHLLPSPWMRSYFEYYTTDQIEVFPHTSK